MKLILLLLIKKEIIYSLLSKIENTATNNANHYAANKFLCD